MSDLPAITPAQARAADVMMKMQMQSENLANKKLLVRAMVCFLAIMITATVYAAFFRKDVIMTVSFSAVDATLGFGYRAMSSHFFPSTAADKTVPPKLTD